MGRASSPTGLIHPPPLPSHHKRRLNYTHMWINKKSRWQIFRSWFQKPWLTWLFQNLTTKRNKMKYPHHFYAAIIIISFLGESSQTLTGRDKEWTSMWRYSVRSRTFVIMFLSWLSQIFNIRLLRPYMKKDTDYLLFRGVNALSYEVYFFIDNRRRTHQKEQT